MRELPTPTLPLASIFESRRLPRAEETVTAQHRLQVTWARTDEELREAQRPQALNEVKASMILDRIGEAENIEVSSDDLERELLMLSLQSREPLEEMRQRLEKDGSLDRIREQMRREKTASVLYEKLAS